jgi:hypothetical protein
MSLMLDANSLIILIKPLPPWGLKGGTTLQQPCESKCSELTYPLRDVMIQIIETRWVSNCNSGKSADGDE